MEPWRAVDAHNGSVGLNIGSPIGSVDQWWQIHHLSEEKDPDPNSSEKLDQVSHLSEKLDPDPHQGDADPQPCIKVTFVDCPSFCVPCWASRKFSPSLIVLNKEHNCVTALISPVLWIRIGFTDPDPDIKEQTNADPDPGQTSKSQKLNFYIKKYS
jgi:hypothetical protein